ncbi:MAG: SLC13 family permease [Candidatus Nezhaarchaeales archaeon]
MIIAVAIFAISVVLIVWGKVHRVYIGLVSIATLIAVGILPLDKAPKYLDVNVVGLLVGMSIITYYLEMSGLAGWISSKIVKITGFRSMHALITLVLLGSLISAILDNVSTTLLLAPIAISLARAFEVSAVPYVIGVALGSNLVGAALMIGDPPSMMVASALNMSFLDFIVFEGKPSIFFMIMASCPVAALTLTITAKKYLKNSRSSSFSIELEPIKDKALLVEAIGVLAVVIALLSIRNIYGIPLWFPPIMGALILLALRAPRDRSLKKVIKGIDWKSTVFVASVLLMVGGLAETGFIDAVASMLCGLCKSDIMVASTTIIWISVLFSAFIDNIPYFAAMIPVVMKLSTTSSMDVHTLMWALLIGGSLGGNCTYIGASANAIAVGLLEKKGFKVSFVEFMRFGVPYTVAAILVGEVLHYLIFIRPNF